ncbi:alkaline phosphatase PhoX [Nitrososphaera sp.]|uniref:alkaline phosphatase PhoX n=1 Tax=Nitrososphaera sp. TaxID=1971748 RepID=UPI00185C85B0|nr:alkaline phosphatase PhoX [Nitrososphaera sp.]NWG36538.1 DUF839 domain-containing protein [Nitrososphaera sp.]
MTNTKRILSVFAVLAMLMPLSSALQNSAEAAGLPEMAQCDGPECESITEIHTIGQAIGDYVSVGVLDGLGAYELNKSTVRVFANHELGAGDGNSYQVDNGMGGTFSLTGARVSYFDINKDTRQIVDSGVAYNRIYDANGNIAADASLLSNDFPGFSRFCSANLFEPYEFGGKRGIEDRIFMTNEEDGGSFNPVGGAFWAIDPETHSIWHVPDLGRGSWESSTQVDTGSSKLVAFILSDDTSPFDADGDGQDEAAPLYLYVGEKKPDSSDFLERNGLRGGSLYVWVSDTGERTPLDFNTSGSLKGKWMKLDTSKGAPSENGSTGYDEYGNPTQRNLWTQAEALGAFGFSRPEDVATNPRDGRQVVLASTGVDTYAVNPAGNGADTFGTIYLIDTDVKKLTGKVTIAYDGDADPARQLRSPDNLDWADNGFVYVQEDKAEDDTLTGEVLFGAGAANPNEASIVKLDPKKGTITRIAEIDRSVVLDPTTAGAPVDKIAADAGGWETSGIVDVSSLFGQKKGTLFLFDVQAHGITDQDTVNADSRIRDHDLKEGGQLLFLELQDRRPNGDN